MYADMKANGYKQGTPVVLTVCNSATTNPKTKENLARDLSKLTGGPVTGYDGFVARKHQPADSVNSDHYYNKLDPGTKEITYKNGQIVR